MLTSQTCHAFSARPPPSSPYENRRSPSEDEDVKPSRHSLGAAGSKVIVDGATDPLGRLVTKKLFQGQHRPYLVVPSLDALPSGLGLDQYKGLTRYVVHATTPMEEKKNKKQQALAAAFSSSPIIKQQEVFPPSIEGLVLVNEAGYTPQKVKDLLSRAGPDIKRVVMLSSIGVNRRDDLLLKLRQWPINLEERHAAEETLIEEAVKANISYTIIRTGKLKGGGGEMGLGYDFYDQNKNLFEAKMDEDFDVTKRGFTLSYCDNIEGETGRILAANTIVLALSSEHVEDVAVAIVSEKGRTFPNFQVAPWDLF